MALSSYRSFTLALVLSFLFSSSLQAQKFENLSESYDTPHALGFAVGGSTAYGLSYRYWPGKFGGRITVGGSNNFRFDRISLGATVLYRFLDFEVGSLYLYQGNHLLRSRNLDFFFSLPDYPERGHEFQWDIINGIGLGLELIAYDYISFNLMIAYSTINGFKGIKHTFGFGIYYLL